MQQEHFPSNSRLIIYFLKGSKRYFFLAIIFAMALSFLDLINPKIISYTVDTVIGDKETILNPILQNFIDSLGGVAYLRQNIWVIAVAIIFVTLLSACSRFLFRLNNTKGAETLVKRMRDELFDHILKLPFKWHSENHTGDIIQRCTSDVEQIKMFLSEQLTSLFRVFVLITLAIMFMARIHIQLTLVTVAFIPIIIGYSFFFHKRIGMQFGKADEEEGRLSAIAQENLTGVRVVRAFGRETYERQRFEKQNREYTDLWIYLMKLLSLFWSTGDLFSHAQIITVMAYGVVLCVNGEISAGNYIAFVYYTHMLMWPVRMLGRVISNLSKAGISIERLRYIMNSEEEKDSPNAMQPDLKQDICFEHVTFQYAEGRRKVLDDVNLTIQAGTTVGILGATGSGKSTLMYLLDRLYELPSKWGKITIGGIDVNDIKRDYLRDNIGMVLQEPYLFSRTLAENIKIARDDASMEEVVDATKAAVLDHSIKRFTEGYETYVGERGVTLSGGQKQRTAIAQMLIRKPPIMVFDDSLSAVDSQTDAQIRANLKENTEGSTVILVAHRITTLMQADKIVVMERGKIVEEGTHEELMAKEGIYAKVYHLQISQGNLEEVEDGKEYR